MRSHCVFSVGMLCLMIWMDCSAVSAEGRIIGRVSSASKKVLETTVVHIEHADDSLFTVPEESFVSQKNAKFKPKFLVIVQGQSVSFKNDDRISHNVFSLSSANSFNLGVYSPGAEKQVLMNEAGLVPLGCKIHPNMAADIYIVQNPFFGIVDAQSQTYLIDHVPPGEYHIALWSKFLSRSQVLPQPKTIRVVDGETVTVNWEFPEL